MIVGFENFSNYGTDETLLLAAGTVPYVSLGGVIATDPDAGSTGNCLLITEEAFVTVSNFYSHGMAYRFYCSSLPSSIGNSPRLAIFYDQFFHDFMTITLYPDGSLGSVTAIYGPWSGSLSYTPATPDERTEPLITPGSWNHLEFQLSSDGVDLHMEVYLNGTLVLDGVTAIIRVHPTFGAIAIEPSGVGHCARQPGTSFGFNYFIKDFVYYENEGTPIGQVLVKTVTRSADVSSGWTKSSGSTEYTLLDEATPNDTDNISTAAGTAPSIGELSNLPANTVEILAVAQVVRAKKSDAGTDTTTFSVDSNGTLSSITPTLSTSYAPFSQIMETDPDTGIAWTLSGFNALRSTFNRTA